MVAINPNDLTITKDAFLRVFESYRKQGMYMTHAYYAATDYVEQQGYKPFYADYKCFEHFYYKEIRKELGR